MYWVISVIDAVFILVTVSVNICLLYFIKNRWKTLKSARVNTLICHLAIGDILVACTTMTFSSIATIHEQWIFGEISCKVSPVLTVSLPL